MEQPYDALAGGYYFFSTTSGYKWGNKKIPPSYEEVFLRGTTDRRRSCQPLLTIQRTG